MKINIIKLCILLLIPLKVEAISFVYNFRMTQASKRQAISSSASSSTNQAPHTVNISIFQQFREEYNGLKQAFFGGMGSVFYVTDHFYFDTHFAVANFHEKLKRRRLSKTETDDVLIDSGFIFSPHEKIRLSILGVVGIPTHRNFGLQRTEFGVGNLSLGLQADSTYFHSKDDGFRLAGRYLRFLPRKSCFENKTYNFSYGNAIDLYFAYYKNVGSHGIEIAYNPTFVFGATSRPRISPDVIDENEFIASSFYGYYQYSFLIGSYNSWFDFNLSYGFYHSNKPFDYKYIVIFWGSWGITF